jgi:hypothetical protein
MSAQENHISLDGPMRRVLATGVPSAEPCPPPDIFAAYYEHSLDPEETERYDVHFASCPSCRAILAGVARASQNTPQALDVKPDSRWNWKSMQLWLATAAAGVAAVLIIVVLYQRSTSNSSTHHAEVAMSRAVATPEPAKSAPPPSAAYAPAPPDAPRDETKIPSLPLTKSARSPQPVAPTQLPARDLGARENASSASDSSDRKRAVPPADQSKGVNGLRDANVTASTEGAATLSESAAGGALAPSARSAQPPANNNQSAANNRAMRAQAGAASSFAKVMKPKAQAQAKDLVVSSPDSKITWTVHTNHVQYAENGQPAAVQDFIPTNSPIAAGSSPGGNVCWLVGADGSVVRTTDGRLWLGTNSPTNSDLTAIKATSARAATVTSADGHTYVTADGGQTWKAQN